MSKEREEGLSLLFFVDFKIEMFDIDYILETKQKLQKNEQNETKNIDNDFI
ncbi:hypothetical protein [Streptococcus oralis]|uniref:hypothetical protein n=1 Tax=Streptococcus oralis TaxID=1303 RepID=UPI002283C49E|nr:hypothetical protein [Streptococcus oralis]MCY7063490.1 hypothetical protein [Streptococcus oralis]